jgi:hypothetical protein
MKLIGSRVEQEMRDELLRSNLALCDGSYGPLVAALEAANVNIAGAFVVKWIHEQAEDIYVVLVSSREVLVVEVPRGEGQVVVERVDLAAYKRKCSKIQRLKIAVAEDLLASRASKLSH